MKLHIFGLALLAGWLHVLPDAQAGAAKGIAAGGIHSAVARADGTVWGWGHMSYGILGDATPLLRTRAWPYWHSPLPVRIESEEAGPLAEIAQVAAGQHYTLALAEDGTVWGWGCNAFGQLGDATQTEPGHFYLTARERSTPKQVRGPGGDGLLTEVVAIAAGYQHAVALRRDGTVWAWGDNSGGQLGDGTTEEASAPVQVLGPEGEGVLAHVTAIAAGTRHTLAVTSDGSVWAWGSNTAGQLGDGSRNDRLTPVRVSGVDTAQSVAASTAYSLVLLRDGTLRAWGSNAFGQIGDGSRQDSAFPVPVKTANGGALSSIAAIDAGRYFAVALDSEGAVWAWGFNDAGLLGDGTTKGSLLPAGVRGRGGEGYLAGVTAISAGAKHVLALNQDGSLWAWGSNATGQLGDGGESSGVTPAPVRDFPPPAQVARGEGQWLPVTQHPGALPGKRVPVKNAEFEWAARYRISVPPSPDDLEGLDRARRADAMMRSQQAHALDFTPVSSGTLEISFSVRVSSAESRTLCVALLREDGALRWRDEAWSLLWGQSPRTLADASGSIAPIAATEWVRCRVVADLESQAYDVWLDGEKVAEARAFGPGLDPGTPVGRLLVGATHTHLRDDTPLVEGEYGEIAEVRIAADGVTR